MRIILGRDDEVAEWVAQRIPHVGSSVAFGPCAGIGVLADDGSIIGGVVFNNWQPACRSVEVSFASDSPRWLTRRIIREILRYPYGQLDCNRLTSVTPRKATSARRFLEAFGFKREGLVREGFGDDDAVISGLLRREWEASRFNQERGGQHQLWRRPASPLAQRRGSKLNGKEGPHTSAGA